MDKKKKLSIIAIALAVIIVALIIVLVYGLKTKTGKTNNSNDVAVSQTQDSEATPQDTATDNGEAGNQTTDAAQTAPQTQGEAQAEEDTKVYTPTFMYFVSNNDATFEAEMQVFNELKAEYDGRVNFDLCNIDEDPERAANFKMGDNTTPYLIMLNTKNDISALEFICADKAKLHEDIEKALNGAN